MDEIRSEDAKGAPKGDTRPMVGATKITSEVKTKDLKRVEAGKRLAAISQAAKEQKREIGSTLNNVAQATVVGCHPSV